MAEIVSVKAVDAKDALSVWGRLNPRDEWLCDLLAAHRALTSEQVARIGYPSLTRARHRLGELHECGVLARFRRLVRPGSQPWRYTLGLFGEIRHAMATEAPMPRPAAVREKIMRLAQSRGLEHLLGVNEFFTALLAHAREHLDCELSEWWSEQHTFETTKDWVRPDGYGRWSEPDPNTSLIAEVRFFLEYDRGNERLAHLVAKLSRYADMSRARVNRPVLFVFPTTARETNFVREATRAGWPRHLKIATTGVDQHRPAPRDREHPPSPMTPTSRVWLPLGTQQRHRLIDLADPDPSHPPAIRAGPHPLH